MKGDEEQVSGNIGHEGSYCSDWKVLKHINADCCTTQ